MVSTWSKLFVADDVVLGAPKFLKFVAADDVVTFHFRVTSSALIISDNDFGPKYSLNSIFSIIFGANHKVSVPIGKLMMRGFQNTPDFKF